MNRFSFSLWTLVTIVVVTAVSFAALRSTSKLWSSFAFTLTIALLSAAILGVIYRRGKRQVFWSGFLLFGWGYLLLVYGPWLKDNVGRYLVTANVISELHPKLQRTVQVAGASGGGGEDFAGGGGDDYGQSMGGGMSMGSGMMGGGSDMAMEGYGGGGMGGGYGGPITRVLGPSLRQVQRVGHSLFALLAACMGGFIARWFSAPPKPKTSSA